LLSFGYERLEQSGKSYIVNGERVSARKKTNNKWFETQDSIGYWDDFYKQKIIWGEISDEPKFTLDSKGIYVLSNKAFLMTGESLQFLLGFLNSKLCEYFFSKVATTTGVGTVQWLKYKVETLPIPDLSSQDQIPFVELIEKILDVKKSYGNTENLENLLDKKIYDLFGFTSDEINVIERRE
jgi:adenine-specific DNA-methyltransferase